MEQISLKEKATEMIRKQFDIIAKASNYKGLKAEGEKKFYTIEKVAKQCTITSIDEVLILITAIDGTERWQDYYEKLREEVINR